MNISELIIISPMEHSAHDEQIKFELGTISHNTFFFGGNFESKKANQNKSIIREKEQ